MVSVIHIDNMRDLIAGLEDRFAAFWSSLVVSQSSKVSEPIAEAPKRVSVARQWTALEDHLHAEMERAQSVLQMQDTATLHLDAAHYALDRIAVELVDVMPSIMTVATVQPPRVSAPLSGAEYLHPEITDRSIAA